MDMLLKCKICDKEFASQRGLHLHIKKQHKVEVKDYYLKYMPRLSKHYKKKIRFKTAKQYLSDDFINREELLDWCLSANKKEVKDYIKKILQERIKQKGLSCGPSHLELEINELPGVDIYKKFFGSYSAVCGELEIEPMFSKKIPDNFFEDDVDSSMKIFIEVTIYYVINITDNLIR